MTTWSGLVQFAPRVGDTKTAWDSVQQVAVECGVPVPANRKQFITIINRQKVTLAPARASQIARLICDLNLIAHRVLS